MIYEYKKSEQTPIDFDFSKRFVSGDDVDDVTVTFSPAAGVTEISGRRALSGRLVQLRFDAHLAELRTVYHVYVEAMAASGDAYTLEADLLIIPDESPPHD